MKKPLAVFTLTLLIIIRSHSAEDQLGESVSPILSVDVNMHGVDGVVPLGGLPASIGVTGVILDLDHIGTDKMLRVRYKGATEFQPGYFGTRYKLHSDQTTEDIKYGTKERTVILIRENENYRDIICYYIRHYEGSTNKEGVHLGDAKTWSHLTMSVIKDDHEVLGQLRFTDDPYNLKSLNNPKPAKEQGGADQPVTAPESKPEGKEKPESETEARPQ
jgi:hypothetical protein